VKPLALLRLYPWELDSLPEYSTTMPTGTTIGKFWKRNTNWMTHGGGYSAPDSVNPKWVVCAYDENPNPKLVTIRIFEVAVLEGPYSGDYRPPDWSNYARWKRDRDAERAEGVR